VHIKGASIYGETYSTAWKRAAACPAAINENNSSFPYSFSSSSFFFNCVDLENAAMYKYGFVYNHDKAVGIGNV